MSGDPGEVPPAVRAVPDEGLTLREAVGPDAAGGAETHAEDHFSWGGGWRPAATPRPPWFCWRPGRSGWRPPEVGSFWGTLEGRGAGGPGRVFVDPGRSRTPGVRTTVGRTVGVRRCSAGPFGGRIHGASILQTQHSENPAVQVWFWPGPGTELCDVPADSLADLGGRPGTVLDRSFIWTCVVPLRRPGGVPPPITTDLL